MAQIAGLVVFVVTAAVFAGLAALVLAQGDKTFKAFPTAFGAVCGAVAAGTMFFDAADLWIRGRTWTSHGVRLARLLALIAVLASLATGLLGDSLSIMALLAPALLVYLFVTRRPAGARAGAARSKADSPQASAVRSRQRRGGKKRR